MSLRSGAGNFSSHCHIDLGNPDSYRDSRYQRREDEKKFSPSLFLCALKMYFRPWNQIFTYFSSIMAYQNRKRNFKTVQERYKRDKRNVKVTTFFIFLAILAIIFFNRQSIWDYLRTYFM
jgi:hypothetical protein